MIHYVVQTNFKSECLIPKLSEMSVFSNAEELTKHVRVSNLKYDCEISTQQSDEICLDMAKDYAKKGMLEVDSVEEKFLINYVREHNYVLIFPVFKLNITKPDGKFGKFKEATLINDKIYLLLGSDRRGIFNNLKLIT